MKTGAAAGFGLWWFLQAGDLAAHHELADPAEIFDKLDRPLKTATSTQALLAALAILVIPLVIIALVFWSRRSKKT